MASAVYRGVIFACLWLLSASEGSSNPHSPAEDGGMLLPDFEVAMGDRALKWGWWDRDDRTWIPVLKDLYENNLRQPAAGLGDDTATTRAARSVPKIPRIIHQVWLGGDPLPAQFEEWRKTWAAKHPGWKLMLWTELEAAELVEMVDRAAFENAANLGAKSDALRLEVLRVAGNCLQLGALPGTSEVLRAVLPHVQVVYRFGGLYVDTDFECLSSFEQLHARLDFFAGTFLLRDLNFYLTRSVVKSLCHVGQPQLPPPVLLLPTECPLTAESRKALKARPTLLLPTLSEFSPAGLSNVGALEVSNGIFAARKRHPLIKRLLEETGDSLRPPGAAAQLQWVGMPTISSTGPGRFTRIVMDSLLRGLPGGEDAGAVAILPTNFFFAMPNSVVSADAADRIRQRRSSMRPESLAVHHWAGSWLKQQMGLPVWEGSPVPSDEKFSIRWQQRREGGRSTVHAPQEL